MACIGSTLRITPICFHHEVEDGTLKEAVHSNRVGWFVRLSHILSYVSNIVYLTLLSAYIQYTHVTWSYMLAAYMFFPLLPLIFGNQKSAFILSSLPHAWKIVREYSATFAGGCGWWDGHSDFEGTGTSGSGWPIHNLFLIWELQMPCCN